MRAGGRGCYFLFAIINKRSVAIWVCSFIKAATVPASSALFSIDLHWGVCLLGFFNPCWAKLSVFLSVGSFLLSEVVIVLVSYSLAVFM